MIDRLIALSPMLKPQETFSILEETCRFKIVLFAQNLFFDLLNAIHTYLYLFCDRVRGALTAAYR